jgi:hypothetical protein
VFALRRIIPGSAVFLVSSRAGSVIAAILRSSIAPVVRNGDCAIIVYESTPGNPIATEDDE